MHDGTVKADEERVMGPGGDAVGLPDPGLQVVGDVGRGDRPRVGHGGRAAAAPRLRPGRRMKFLDGKLLTLDLTVKVWGIPVLLAGTVEILDVRKGIK
jgi:hypothetical protein